MLCENIQLNIVISYSIIAVAMQTAVVTQLHIHIYTQTYTNSEISRAWLMNDSEITRGIERNHTPKTILMTASLPSS